MYYIINQVTKEMITVLKLLGVIFFNFVVVTPCNSSPCVSPGTCVIVNGSHACVCPTGYSGKLCEGTITEIYYTITTI